MSDARPKEVPAKRPYHKHRIRRAAKALVGAKRNDTTFARRPDEYFEHFYVNRQLSETITFLAKANHLSKKATVEQLLEAGLSRVFTEAILENNRREAAMREQGLPAKPTALVRELVRLAKSKGLKAGDYF